LAPRTAPIFLTFFPFPSILDLEKGRLIVGASSDLEPLLRHHRKVMNQIALASSKSNMHHQFEHGSSIADLFQVMIHRFRFVMLPQYCLFSNWAKTIISFLKEYMFSNGYVSQRPMEVDDEKLLN
jgi:hypothetical protein